MRRRTRSILPILFLTLLVPLTGHAKSVKRSFCVYDPVGQNGFIAQQFKDYLVEARDLGVDLELITYSDEKTVASDFRAGHCDAAGMTGIRVHNFIKFAGSLDMVGGLQTYEQERKAIQVMSSKAADDLMSANGYAVAGVVPGGKVFLFSRKKRYLDSLEAAAGKEVAVIGFDKQAKVVASVAGASPVPASIATFGPMFNNGSVDLAYAPAFAYKALELYKGLQNNGGVADFILGMLSLQLLVHEDRFPEDFAKKSRRWVTQNLWDPIIGRIKKADDVIPEKYWVHINGKRETKYRRMLVEIRQRLWEQNWYSHKMQHLLKKIRCNSDAGLAECSKNTEGGAVQ